MTKINGTKTKLETKKGGKSPSVGTAQTKVFENKTAITNKKSSEIKPLKTEKIEIINKTEKVVLPIKEEKTVQQKDNKLKVLFAASECQPFIATGGLGDVIGSLPKAIYKSGVEVRVVIPLFADISKSVKDKLSFIGSTEVSLSWRKQYCGIYFYKEDDVTFYFIDNEYYYGRHGLYGHYDDGERFAFFSKSVIDILKVINYIPDIIHCHDWQTALIPIYLKSVYVNDEKLNKIKTVFTIHNIEYQGKFCMNILEDVFGVPQKYVSLAEYQGNINLIKGAVQCCDIVSTVSPTYAEEIMTPEYSHGLHFILKENKYKSRGILNGIDYEMYNPMTDKALFKNFGVKTLEFKTVNKIELQKLLNLPIDADIPMIAIITRLVNHKGMDLIKRKIDDILKERIQLVILGKGEIFYENMLLDMQKIYSEKMRAIIAYNPDLARKIYAGADIFLMPSKSEPCGLAQMIASRYGTVPITRETGGLADSVKDIGIANCGNGFTFKDYNADDMHNRIINALKMYYSKEEWQKLVSRVISVDFTWDKSAQSYCKMYKEFVINV